MTVVINGKLRFIDYICSLLKGLQKQLRIQMYYIKKKGGTL